MDPYIKTYKGHIFRYDDVENNVIDIEDIAHALSLQPRWMGHTKTFYSVAAHSLACSFVAFDNYKDTQIALDALLHDAAEAYLVDIARPIKQLLNGYYELEKKIERRIADVLGNNPGLANAIVREIDDRMLATEWKYLTSEKNQDVLQIDSEPYSEFVLYPDNQKVHFATKMAFVRRYTTLKEAIHDQTR